MLYLTPFHSVGRIGSHLNQKNRGPNSILQEKPHETMIPIFLSAQTLIDLPTYLINPFTRLNSSLTCPRFPFYRCDLPSFFINLFHFFPGSNMVSRFPQDSPPLPRAIKPHFPDCSQHRCLSSHVSCDDPRTWRVFSRSGGPCCYPGVSVTCSSSAWGVCLPAFLLHPTRDLGWDVPTYITSNFVYGIHLIQQDVTLGGSIPVFPTKLEPKIASCHFHSLQNFSTSLKYKQTFLFNSRII